MDLSINYPYGIPFYANIKVIIFTIINNSQDILYIYFVSKNILGDLVSIVFPFEKKKYHFPEKSKISIISQKYPDKTICNIKIKNNWTYIYP